MVPSNYCRGCYFQGGFVPKQNNKHEPETILWVAQKPVLLLPVFLHPLISCLAGQADACSPNISRVWNNMSVTR